MACRDAYVWHAGIHKYGMQGFICMHGMLMYGMHAGMRMYGMKGRLCTACYMFMYVVVQCTQYM